MQIREHTTMKHLKLWTHPGNYVGATWYDWYSVAGRHRESDALTRSNWECWVEWIRELLGDEVEDSDTEIGWHIVQENHWAVGWVEWLGVHKDVSPEILAKIDEKLHDLDGYPVFNEDHFSNLEQHEYEERFIQYGATNDWIRELRHKFSDECMCRRVVNYIEDKFDWQLVMAVHESLIPCGEYFNSDNSGIWPHLDLSIDGLSRDGLAKLAWAHKYRGPEGVYDLLSRSNKWND